MGANAGFAATPFLDDLLDIIVITSRDSLKYVISSRGAYNILLPSVPR
jgi:hypothetical protein